MKKLSNEKTTRSTTRLQRCFQDLRARKRCAFCVFLTAGDPSCSCSERLLQSLEGVDLIEIGMPFSDPIADGETIQRSSARALAGGTTLEDVMRIARTLRAKKPDTPIVLMGYANPVYRFSLPVFAEQASASGVDGVILVDLPPEEDAACRIALAEKGIALVRLATPTSDDKRLKTICSDAQDSLEGFLYVVSVAGTTGKKQADEQQLQELAQRLRRHTKLPLVAGFGVRDKEQVARVARHFDGVVIGSAFVAEVAQSSSCDDAVRRVRQRCQELQQGLQGNLSPNRGKHDS